MSDHPDESLTAAERAALARWADTNPPAGFADRVMAAWEEADAGSGHAATSTSSGGASKGTVIAIVSAMLAAAAALALFVRTPATADAQITDVAKLRADARAVLMAHCTPCHDGTHGAADPIALRIFDLSADDWWTMPATDALPAMNDRMAGSAGPTEADRARVAAFVDAELRRRAGAG